jgi:hypothetical protein
MKNGVGNQVTAMLCSKWSPILFDAMPTAAAAECLVCRTQTSAAPWPGVLAEGHECCTITPGGCLAGMSPAYKKRVLGPYV